VILFDAYIARHAKEVAAMQAMPLPASPRVMMSILGPFVGMMRRFGAPVPGASGIVIGLLAWMASKLVARKTTKALSR
jgi:hypothetical protein